MQRALTVALIVLGVWALVSWSAPGAPADPDAAAAWQADLGPALEQARREGKDVLVDFTGSDWCGWCTRLHDEVFGRAGFVDAVAGDFVLVALDFPRAGGRAWEAMPAALRERNAREARAFGVSGFPTVLLMTPEGVAYARSGYREGGAAAYAEHVEALRAGDDRRAVQERLALLQQTAVGQGQRLDAAYTLLGATAAVGREPLLELIAELDPGDPRGVLAGRALERPVGRAMDGEAR